MKKIADYLKNAPNGTKLYSPIFGECTFKYVDRKNEVIVVTLNREDFFFGSCGQFLMDSKDDEEGECLLFPSKEQRDWNNFPLPTSHSFKLSEPHNFKPFDKVVVRDDDFWYIDFFERFDPSKKLPYRCVGSNWKHCLPFNDETTILIGTSNSLNNEETND